MMTSVSRDIRWIREDIDAEVAGLADRYLRAPRSLPNASDLDAKFLGRLLPF